MSHHYTGPDWGFPLGDARVDLTDLYAFTTAEPFAPEAVYELKIDTNGDAVADIAYRVRFSSQDGLQTATLRRIEGAQAVGMGDGGKAIVEGAPVSMGREERVTQAGEHGFFAGWRSDPFFFDRRGALNNLQFTGADFVADKDVCSIVLEVPNYALGSRKVGLWHRTLVRMDGPGGGWGQAERGAHPLLFFLVLGLGEAEQAAYLAGDPADDTRFVAGFAHALEHAGGYTPKEATRVASTLLPEIMPYDPTRPASFPHSGRTLTDDAADAFLAILTNGKVTEDQVGPHVDQLAEFPYLGPPHNA